METRNIVTVLAVGLSVQAHAFNYRDMKPLKLEVPEMKPELVILPEQPTARLELAAPVSSPKMDFDFFKTKTTSGIKPYKVMDDLTFVGVPLFVAGWAVKGDKAMFRVNRTAEQGGKKNTQLLTDFKTGIDDYTQFFGPAMVVGLKLGGYEGRSDWPRLMTSAAMSYGIMAGFVNGIKYTAKEMRPDGSTANSWPSGHTATAFVGATLLHKEYGLTRSPWWSVAGYGVATATGVMRVMNNRHWISDVMSGAGIGIMSTELGYALSDIFFKERGLLHSNLEFESENPSFFSISMGLGLGGKDLTVEDEMGDKMNIKFRAATVVDAEGAYFFNKYVGVGGRLRVRAMSAKDFGDFAQYVAVEDWNAWSNLMPIYMKHFPNDYPAIPNAGPIDQGFVHWDTFNTKIGLMRDGYEEPYADAPVTDIYGVVKSDHIAEFTGSLGLYFNLPLDSHFSLGTKALIGRSFTQELDIDGHAEGNVKDISFTMTLDNRPGMKGPDSTPSMSLDNLEYPVNTGEKWSDDWDYLTLGAESSTSWGTGISLTYKYKTNFSWRLFCDYDFTTKKYTATYDPFHFVEKSVTPGAYILMDSANEELGLNKIEYKKKKNMNFITLGLSFLVNL